MNLRQRCQTVFKAGYEFGQTSFRHLAQKTKLSKSSVHRLYHRIARRNQHPESSLWEIESKILDYQKQQEQKLRTQTSGVEVCAAADETFFDQVILVMLDLPSGYIFVEEITEDCQYQTWQEKLTRAFQPLGLKVKYLVSDRAKAIVKLALQDLGTTSIADLFHVLYNLNRLI